MTWKARVSTSGRFGAIQPANNSRYITQRLIGDTGNGHPRFDDFWGVAQNSLAMCSAALVPGLISTVPHHPAIGAAIGAANFAKMLDGDRVFRKAYFTAKAN